MIHAMIQAIFARRKLVPVLTLATSLGLCQVSQHSFAQDVLGSAAAVEGDVDALIAALQAEDSDVRRAAAEALGTAGDDSERVIEALMKAVGDPDTRNRLVAVSSIRQLVSDPAKLVPLASELLAHEDQLLASRAVEALVIRGPKAVPFLKEALKNERAAYWASLAIEEIGPQAAETLPELRMVVANTEDQQLRVQAILAIAKLGPIGVQAYPEMIASLAAENTAPVKTAAAFAAGTLRITQAKDALIANTKSNDKLVAMESVWALAKIYPDNEEGQALAVETLIEGLTDEDPTLRMMAAKGLQLLQADPELVVPRLTAVLNEKDAVVGYHIAEAFASLGEPAAERAAMALATEELRGLAFEVLERLGPKAAVAVPQLVSLLADATGEFRQKLQAVLGDVGPAAAPAVPELVRSLQSDDPATRISAILAIGNIGPAASVAKEPLLARAGLAEIDFESVAAAWALVKVAADDPATITTVVPVLIQGLAMTNPLVQIEAAAALGEIGPAAVSALPALNAVAADESLDRDVRKAAAEAAAKLR